MELKVDDERANEISMRVAAATKGPWTSTALTEDDDEPVDRVYDDKGRLVCQMWPNEGAFSAFERSQYDGLFTAHARQDVPDLLADRATLLARVRELEAVLGESSDLYAYGVGAMATHDPANRDRCTDEAKALMARIKAALAGAGRDGAGEGR